MRSIIFCFTFLFFICAGYAKGDPITLHSPDSVFRIRINCDDSIYYNLFYRDKEIIKPSHIGLEIQKGEMRKELFSDIEKVSYDHYRGKIHPLYGKFKELDDSYNEVTIDFDLFSVIFRAYNEGVAYRFITKMDGEIMVVNEIANFNLPDNPSVILPETENYTSWELMYVDYASHTSIHDNKRSITPVLLNRKAGVKVVINESDVRNYPGMYLVKNRQGFTGDFALYPDSVSLGSWGNFVSVVRSRKDYIAEVDGCNTFPWRIVSATDDDRQLLTNELVYKLATPLQIEGDVSWIKPGKAAWEWWHDAMLPDAPIPSGMENRNTALYKYYIDFAAEYGLEYLLIDAGWSNIFELSRTNKNIDIPGLIEYGKSKNVGIFLWCTSTSLKNNADTYLKMISNWGAVGIKVDFFDRDDQLEMEWYETLAAKAATYKLMVNYHGCSKPTGLQRTYPNIITFEAVRGAECAKWDLTASPKHHVTFPFIRMLNGSLDYTPGSMRNASPQLFKPIAEGMPYSQGTRCHQLAMYVVYDQYLAMLCDAPTEYRKFPDIMEFLATVPVTFDHTRVLDAEIGEYIVTAKQNGNNWFIGGMTNWKARDAVIDFSFLSENGSYIATIYRDGKNANLYAEQYTCEKIEVNSTDKMSIRMAQGGGFAIMVTPL
ncbi:glycoside hydrolase family 97 protein [Proteiniphilum acetatigenes]|uniref:glycoside hydrolase family 97 protein n=1 Tax=Proteiniphilum acetatigenes TaxID=294710 RepID=UPI0004759B89|nr:glycoside hydrolase family 97 protein [Proteiniphilum acetatigenes]